MRLLRIVPENTHFGFMKNRFISFTLSGTLAVLSIVMFFSLGLNYGIDFEGGTVVEIATKNGPANIGDIRSELRDLNLGDVQVQEFGAPNDVLIRIERQQGGEQAQQKAIGLIRDTFGDTVDFRRVEVVGPRVSGELAQAGTLAVVVSLFAVLVYIWFRFEWQFAVGAIIATVHDVILTIGMFAVLHLDFSLSSIAAILTIVGYSLNDTVVVYDRIREDMRKYKKMPLLDLLDRAINQTLSRTTMTSFTTLLALLSLYTFGGEVIRSFTFAMIWGVLVGTYSSIFVAAPVLNFLNLRRGPDASGGTAEKEQAETA
ncbi:protein translocase subunit secF [Breoghania corrubedonensis]|uniref:Protein-export membrane protein SecF n=1 Tax=Breoghania corrubedonensis TaxID=665038 RepID=A0A2T5V8H5_9HYPH|nr:protein translocase subunit SecF [Breoghania corrubedonensis]PTW60052.1 protein translocase subunit secF [Breoghania corrubedonensis]